MKTAIFIFGFGYTASFLAKQLRQLNIDVVGTSRHLELSGYVKQEGYQLIEFTEEDVEKHLKYATHILITTPPTQSGDPVLTRFKSLIIKYREQYKWIGYLSSTGVYGGKKGDWVEENALPQNLGTRGEMRLQAENAWLDFAREYELPIHLFRLSGIYGPNRNMLVDLLNVNGNKQNIYKEGQYFSRIHVDDICNILLKSMEQPKPYSIYNLADNEPCPSHEVMEYAASLLKIPTPPRIPYETAVLSPMAKEFYSHNRRISNAKIIRELNIKLTYPSYREGLMRLFQSSLKLAPNNITTQKS